MLNLGPPYFISHNVPVMGDAHDPNQFYYFPNRPHVPLDETGKPLIRLLILRDMDEQIRADQDNGTQTGSDDDVAGFVYFDTVCSWPQSTLDDVRDELIEHLAETLPLNPDGTQQQVPVRLSPVPLRRGGVQLTFLDQRTPAPQLDPATDTDPTADTDPATAEPSEWVKFLSAPATPSLYGENRAVFMAELTRKAATMMYAAFDGLIPASVMYDLEYVGQSQAYSVSVTADWDQVFDFVQNRFDANFLFVQAEVDDIVQSLEDAQIITIEAEVDSTDALDPAVLEKEFDDVRKDLQKRVLDTFFEPAPNPFEVAPITESGFDDAIDSVVNAAVLFAGYGTASYQRKAVSIEELRSLNIDYTVRRAVTRRIAPQAHINVLFDDLDGVTRDDIVTVVDTNDDLWKQTDFTTSVAANFAEDGIDTIVMDVQYVKQDDFAAEPDPDANPEAIWSFVFTDADTVFRKGTWFDPEIGPSLFYRYRVVFKPDAIPGPQSEIITPWQRIDSQRIVANTRALFEKQEVAIQTVSSFDWERYPDVLVRMRYSDPISSWVFEDSKLITQSDPVFNSVFRQRTNDGIEPEYKVSLIRDDGEQIDLPWATTDGNLTVIKSPDPSVHKVVFFPVPDPTLATMIVNARYTDADNNIHEDFTFFVTPETMGQHRNWDIPWKDVNKRTIEVQQITIDVDNNVTDTGFIPTDAATITLGKVFANSLEVQPTLIGPDLADQDVERVILRMQHIDPTDGRETDYLHEFRSLGDAAKFKVRMNDPSARDYSYELTFVLNSGFTRTQGTQISSDPVLVLSSQVPQ